MHFYAKIAKNDNLLWLDRTSYQNYLEVILKCITFAKVYNLTRKICNYEHKTLHQSFPKREN